MAGQVGAWERGGEAVNSNSPAAPFAVWSRGLNEKVN